jgi:hypothetical protein
MEIIKDMKIKKLIGYYLLGKSIKEIELDRILDKISNLKKLTKKEINFLNLYQETREEDVKDYMYLSKNSTSFKIREFLDNGVKVICDLSDRDGKISLRILDIENDYDEEKSILTLKDNSKYYLDDKFLYNLIYIKKRGEYSLQEQDEYFEKIEEER